MQPCEERQPVLGFINHGNNGFVAEMADYKNMSVHDQDEFDLNNMYEILEQQMLPLYYDNHETWRQIVKNGMRDVRFQFDSNRMAHEYYEKMYNVVQYQNNPQNFIKQEA